MSDSRNIVTGGFFLTAIVLSIAAYLFYPKSSDSGISSSVNKPLFAFESKDVRSLTITKFDSDKNESSSLVLDRSLNFGWTVQSRQNYPVDSAERISKTSASLVGLVILDIASEDPNDEETYGVIEPADGIKVGQKGVGIKVTLQDRSKKELAAAIIGKAVKNNPAQRFVRVPKQRIIYVCEFDPSILTTNLFAWINPRILSSGVGTQFDIDSINMQNYAAASNGLIQVQKNYEFAASLNANSWATDSLVIGDGAKNSEYALKKNALEPLREAITAFQITDVFKKSGGLAKTLSERKPIPNTFQIVEPIRKMGFFIDDKQTPLKVLSAGGQLSFTTSAGLAYQLWFGNLLPGTSGNPDQRYLMVSVDVDESKFPMPIKPGAANAAAENTDQDGTEKENNDPPSPPKSGCEPNSVESTATGSPAMITKSQDDEREANRQYQIQLDTRNEKLSAARKIADNINKRYADWFYLVDNAVYERVMPAQENLISTK